jgi:chemotaxis response regulator CheB
MVSSMPDAVITAGTVDFEFAPLMIAKALIAFTMARGAAEWFYVRHPCVVT